MSPEEIDSCCYLDQGYVLFYFVPLSPLLASLALGPFQQGYPERCSTGGKKRNNEEGVGMEGWRKGRSGGGRDGWKEGRSEGVKEGRREGGKEGRREGGKKRTDQTIFMAN